MTTPLAGLRAQVHAGGVAAAYAARMLGVLGGAVTLIEPPGGTPLRREPPFLPGSDVSALFAYLTAGMASATGDPRDYLGQADIFIDDTPLAERENLGLDTTQIAVSHPDLIHVSVLPFGAFGPKAHWKGEEITVLHASGEGYLLPNGLTCERFPGRSPVKPYGHFTEMQGGIAAALGALTALWARPDRGGQFVDIASQDAGLAVGAFAIQRLGDGSVEHRIERSFRYGGVVPCRDGHVELLTLEQRQWEGLVKLLGEPDWARDPALADSLERSRRGPELNQHIRAWAATRLVEDIVRDGQKLSVPLAKYYTPLEVVRDPHEAARGLFQPVDIPGAGKLDMLVSPFHFDGAPLSLAGGPPARRPGLDPGPLAGTQQPHVRTPAVPGQARNDESRMKPPSGRPLAGIRIADFTVHNAGPFCTHLLSQLGAEVIKVESAIRPDAFRKPHPVYGREGPATFDQVASTKLSVRINLKKPEGIALAKRLVAVSDIAAESFRPGVIGRLGLGYEVLRAVKRDIIMLSVSSSGQSGPDAHFAGYAPLFGAWGGLSELTGFADGPPVEMRHVMDHTVGMNSAVAVLAALQRRRVSGEGAYIDVAAREVASSLIGEALLMAAAGVELTRAGNAHPRMDPHGVYPCLGEDRWLSIAAASDAERQALAALIGAEPSEEAISAWTRTRDANAAAELLQSRGIAAHASWTTPEIANDPHLRARRAIVDVAEPDGTKRAAVGVPMRLSKGEQIGIDRGTPQLGEHEDYVYGELLGLGRAERQALESAEVIH